MGDREATILGAGDTIEVGNGKQKKEYKLRPVVARHLCDLEREALKFYKRQYLTTFSDNMDLLGNGEGTELLQEEMRKAASWSLNDLQQKTVYDTSRIPITSELKKWVKDRYDEIPDEDDSIRALLSTALDQGSLKSRDVQKMTKKFPLQGKVRYDQWWITACMEGMISFIVSSVQLEHKNVTKNDVQEWSFAKIAEAARKVEAITTADMGNT